MSVYKNVGSQKIAVYAHDVANDVPKTGDAANITAQISLDFGAAAAITDTNPTELDSTDHPGVYVFDLTQGETDAEVLVISAKSATADVQLDPLQVFTSPPSLTSLNVSGVNTLASHDPGETIMGATDALTITTNNDKTGYALTSGERTSIAAAVWDALTSGMSVVGSIGVALTTAASNVATILSRIVGTLAAGTHNPQTGDSFARLGAPVGASVSADIAAVKTDSAAALADTNELQTDWADGGRLNNILDARASQASVDDLPTNAELTTALAAADDAVLAAIAALNNLSAAQVNAEVVDALATDTYAQPGQETPGATVALSYMIRFLYKLARNKITQTSTTFSLFNDDAATVDQKATVSDDGTTATRGEIATGP